MKAYTNVEQSKILAEILPLESADMKWYFWKSEIDAPKLPTFGYDKDTTENCKNIEAVYLPCWSLVALLKKLPETMLGKDNDGYVVMVETMGSGLTTFASNPVDACYEMIIKLKEKNLI